MDTKKDISDQAARLKKIRLYLGMTREQFGTQLGISQYTMRSWENGIKNFTELGVKKVIVALKNKLNFHCSFDWLMHGVGDSPILLYEEKNKLESDEIQFDLGQEKLLKEVILFKKLNKNVNVIIVPDNRFAPLATPGDYIGLQPIELIERNGHVGHIVFYMIDDHHYYYFGPLLKRGKKYFIQLLSEKVVKELKPKEEGQLFLLVWFRKLI